ncbi:MAG: TIGR03621 family F420-dependent LLM class oxidoreductase [Thermomicrobiales bacterium]|nr:TIGR03621 family F420-dependent LLM class oxidoreductase [Thermomicrobiales bacterium]
MTQKSFRFGVQGRSTGPREAWIAMIRRVEELGYASYVALDHFVRGLDTTASLMAAAMVSDRLRIGSFVFDNDFRHPALLAKAATTLDVLSGGRFELGIGAGWLKEEYDQTGIPFDPAAVRIERMVEAVHLLKKNFTEEHPVSFHGTHYTVEHLICPPHPVQKPHPPIMIGGGSKRILSVAGREADIVGITTRAKPNGDKDFADCTAAATERKIAWVREAAGERFPALELNLTVSDIQVTDDAAGAAERIGAAYGLTAAEVLDSPHILLGTVDERVERLRERRERFGFSYIIVTEPNLEALGPVVARLAGR